MQKEKKVRTYQRRTKSGKMVTVRAHTAKYDAAEEAKELAKKKGSGDELEARKRKLAMEQLAGKKAAEELERQKAEKETEEEPNEKKARKSKKEESKKETKKKAEKKVRPVGAGTNGPEPRAKKTTTTKKTASTSSEPAFTQAEYKAWYHWDQENDPKNKSALKVAKALRAQMGRAAYNRYFNEMSDNYSARGHISAYKKLGSGSDAPTKSKSTSVSSAKSTEGKSWGSAMKEKYPGATGKNAEIRSLLGVSHSMRLAPSGYTKGAVTTAIKELRKEGSPESIKMAERIEKTMLGKKSASKKKL